MAALPPGIERRVLMVTLNSQRGQRRQEQPKGPLGGLPKFCHSSEMGGKLSEKAILLL